MAESETWPSDEGLRIDTQECRLNEETPCYRKSWGERKKDRKDVEFLC